MPEENVIVQEDDTEDFAEELSLEFDAGQDPEAVWEWNGEVLGAGRRLSSTRRPPDARAMRRQVSAVKIGARFVLL